MQAQASVRQRRTAVRATGLLLLVSFLVVRILFWVLPGIFEPWSFQAADRLFDLRSLVAATQPVYDSTVVHVDISDRTIRTLQQSYLSRKQYARVVENLGRMNVAVQAWDFIFLARTNEEDDRALIEATANVGNVLYGVAFEINQGRGQASASTGDSVVQHYLDQHLWRIRVEGDPTGMARAEKAQITFTDLARAAKGLGSLNLHADRDGVFRRVPLLFQYGSAWYPTISFLTICHFLRVPPEQILLKPGKSITLLGAQTPHQGQKDIVIPIDGRGNMIVNYIGGWERMKHYDFADLLRASEDRLDLEIWAEELAGKVVMVSQVTTGSADVGPVPTDNNFPLSGVHANAVHTILTGNFLREATSFQTVAGEAVLLLLLFGLSLRTTSLTFSLGAIGLLLLFLVTGSVLFLVANTMVDLVQPSLMLVVGTFFILAYRYVNEEKQKEALRRSFEAYFPPSIVQKVVRQPELVTTGAQKKELTVLFSDIKSFTTYSSTMQPDDIHRLLNEYFEAMVEIVFRHGGTVDKFIGDGLMVFFGDPEPQSDHAVRCVRAAVEMQKTCRRLKAKWEAAGYFPLKIRIGINTGVVVVGNMGSSKRLSYTVLGADVNLAQRLESNAPVEGILISRRTYELVKDDVPTRPHEPIRAKGIDQPIEVYEVPVE